MKDNQINKKSDWYNYYSNDFSHKREKHFFSIFYQASFIIRNPEILSVLEFGTGRNITKALVEHFGIKHYSVDFDDKRFKPDHVSTILDFKSDEKYDIVCAFQVLEHNPLETIPQHLKKMAQYSNRYVLISVPYSGRWISINLNLNFMPTRFGRFSKLISFTFPRLIKKKRDIAKLKTRKDKYNPHWWEVGDAFLSKRKFSKIIKSSDLKILKNFHNPFFPYHIFYLLEKE